MSTVSCTDDALTDINKFLLKNKNERNSVNSNSILSVSTHSLFIESNDSFAKSFLDAHNRLRKLVNF